MKLFDLIDIFGTHIQFTLNNRAGISTLGGGIITLLISIFFIGLFFLLGNDFINKKNPKISTSIYEQVDYPFVNMSKYNLTVAILMSTTAVKNTDIFNGLFNPRYTYYRQLYNKSTDDYEYNDAFSIKQEEIQCSEEFLIKYNLPYGTYACINFMGDGMLGGGFGLDEYAIPVLFLGFCKYGYYFNNSQMCNSLNEYDKDIPYSATIYYPTVLYDPNNHDNPITIIYNRFSVFVELNFPKNILIAYSTTIFEDDSGIIVEKRKNSTYYSVDQYEVSNYYLKDEKLQIPYSSSDFLTIQLALNKKITYHRRSYQKLPEVLSSMFSIIKIVICVVQTIFILFINPIIKEFTLLNLFYDTSKNTSSFQYYFKKESNLSNSKSGNISISNNYLVEQNKTPITNSLKCSTLATSMGTPTRHLKKEKNNKLTIYEYFYYTFKKCKHLNTEKLKIIDRANNSIHEFFDLKYYTKIIYDFQIMKKYVFKNDNFLFLLTNFYKKANMWKPNEIRQLYGFNINTNSFIEEYKNNKDNPSREKIIETLRKNDEFFLNLVQDNVKENIINLSESIKV